MSEREIPEQINRSPVAAMMAQGPLHEKFLLLLLSRAVVVTLWFGRKYAHVKTSTVPDRSHVAVVAGARHTCALKKCSRAQMVITRLGKICFR